MMHLRELRIRALAAVCAALFFVCALAFAVFAGYLVLLDHMDPQWAALATGGACFLASGLVLMMARLAVRRARVRESADQGNPADAIEGLLKTAIDDDLVGIWIQRRPGTAAAASLVLGVAAGYSRSVRRVLQDIWLQSTDGERPSRRR